MYPNDFGDPLTFHLAPSWLLLLQSSIFCVRCLYCEHLRSVFLITRSSCSCQHLRPWSTCCAPRFFLLSDLFKSMNKSEILAVFLTRKTHYTNNSITCQRQRTIGKQTVHSFVSLQSCELFWWFTLTSDQPSPLCGEKWGSEGTGLMYQSPTCPHCIASALFCWRLPLLWTRLAGPGPALCSPQAQL